MINIHNFLQIASSSNPKFKVLQSLEKSKVRRKMQLAPVEGEKEIEMAMEAGMDFQSVFFSEGIADMKFIKTIQRKRPDAEFFEIGKNLFSKISYRESTGGLIAVVRTKTRKIEDLILPVNPLVLVIEGVEKPGNLGAILRTADAAAIDAVICCNLPGDIYNPNLIRASLGTVFTVPLAISDNEETMMWLKNRKIKTFVSDLHNGSNYYEQKYTGPSAIVVGAEATGISEHWTGFADRKVKIPMFGKIDSMNVSVATAIMLYEARRQRSEFST